jgi:hypothetical protein
MILLDVDPSVVKPGWTAFIVVMLLAVALVFLYLSMRKQFRKIQIPKDEPSAGDTSDGTEEPASRQPPHTQG